MTCIFGNQKLLLYNKHIENEVYIFVYPLVLCLTSGIPHHRIRPSHIRTKSKQPSILVKNFYIQQLCPYLFNPNFCGHATLFHFYFFFYCIYRNIKISFICNNLNVLKWLECMQTWWTKTRHTAEKFLSWFQILSINYSMLEKK